MLLGERGKFGGTVDVTGGEKKPPSVYGSLCTLVCLCNCVFILCAFALVCMYLCMCDFCVCYVQVLLGVTRKTVCHKWGREASFCCVSLRTCNSPSLHLLSPD